MATLGLIGLGVSELISLRLGSLRRDSSGGLVLVTGAAGQDQVIPHPGLADLIDAYLASRKAWLDFESPDAALFIDTSAQPMTSPKVQYVIQRLYEHSGLDSQLPENTAAQTLHATFVAEALAHCCGGAQGFPVPSPVRSPTFGKMTTSLSDASRTTRLPNCEHN